jgi:hypothetical protein
MIIHTNGRNPWPHSLHFQVRSTALRSRAATMIIHTGRDTGPIAGLQHRPTPPRRPRPEGA